MEEETDCLVTLGQASYPTISHTSVAMWTVNAMAAKLSLPPMTTIAEEETDAVERDGEMKVCRTLAAEICSHASSSIISHR